MTGKVITWKTFKRRTYGWIKGTDDKTYFFKSNESIDYQEYKEGDSVEFNSVGERATNVKKINYMSALSSSH